MILVASVAVVMLSLSSCGGSDSKGSSEKEKAKTRDSSESTNTKFKNDVINICKSADKDIFKEIQTTAGNIQEDPEAFQNAIQAGEDDLDRVIAALDGIDPPAQYSDDWNTLIDNISAIRDSYPQLGEGYSNLTTLSEDARDTSDPAAQAKALEDIATTQTSIEALFEDLSQRQAELQDIADKRGLDGCSFE